MSAAARASRRKRSSLLLAHQIRMKKLHRNFVTDVQALRTKNRAHAPFAEVFYQFVLGIEDQADARIR